MSLLAPPDYRGPLSAAYVSQVYVPAAVMIAACTVAKKEWLPFAVAISLGLFGFTFMTSRPVKTLDKNKFQSFKLKEKTVLSHNVAIYRFALPSKSHILGLPIGQHISVSAKIEDADVMRSYTPISSDENSGYFDLLIKSYPTGRISKHMAELHIGDSLKVRGPKGAMVYQPNMVRHFGMIAGGTGITPMLQIIRAVIRGRPANGGTDVTQIDLIFANVNPDDILLQEDLNKLDKEDDRFRVHYVLNNPPEKWSGGVGFVTEDMIKKWLPAPADDVKILVCGPPPMINAMKKATEAVGFKPTTKPASKLHDQVFCF